MNRPADTPVNDTGVPLAVVVMGVSGTGKSTLGALLAKTLGCPFLEGDDFHAPAAVEKMRAGHPLEDADRWPWLDRLGAAIGAGGLLTAFAYASIGGGTVAVPGPRPGAGLLLLGTLAMIVQTGAEEVYFRGWLQRSVGDAWGPLAALLLSDLVLGFYSGMWVQYVAVAMIAVLGWGMLSRVSFLRVAGAAAGSSVLFFLVSNFGTWALSGMYPLTPAGLAACYAAAVPFFQNTLAGDLFFSALLFGGFALVERSVPPVRLQPA